MEILKGLECNIEKNLKLVIIVQQNCIGKVLVCILFFEYLLKDFDLRQLYSVWWLIEVILLTEGLLVIASGLTSWDVALAQQC